MNKQELIEHINNTLFDNLKDTLFTEPTLSITESAKDNKMAIKFETEQGGVLVGGMLKKFEKVTIPQFVADWLKYCKLTGVDLYHALGMGDLYFGNYANQKDDLKLKDFLGSAINQETFARAWLDGFEIEKEKRYLVKIKGAVSSYLNYDSVNEWWFLNKKHNGFTVRTHHTRKELEEAGFGEVFNNPMFEVKEVEE